MAVALAIGGAPAQAEDFDAYLEANLLSIFYHELGHALIDVLAMPVFGQEEDAADTASILLIDALYDEDKAEELARDAALGFLHEAETDEEQPAWWGQHGLDIQRYYNLVCLFYGADPEARDLFAEELGLPEERAETCPEEFELANDSWGPIFDEVFTGQPNASLSFEGADDTAISELIRTEVAALNSEVELPHRLIITVEPCGEANAFYDLDLRQIVMCTELRPHLFELWSSESSEN